MPSLWDLLCITRQQKYTTDGRSPPSTGRRRRQWKGRPRNEPLSQLDNYYVAPEPNNNCNGHQQDFDSLSYESLIRLMSGSQHSGTGNDPEGQGRQEPNKGLFECVQNGGSSDRSDLRHGKQGKNSRPRSSHVPHQDFGGARPQSWSPEAAAAAEEEESRKQDRGKKRHVRDVFRQQDSGQGQAVSPRSHSTSVSSLHSRHSSSNPPTARSLVSQPRVPPGRSRQTESMYQYTPRSVNDEDVSAALFGSRVDDFVHDPDWNRAMDRFAASPLTGSAFSFDEQSVFAPSPSPRPVSASHRVSSMGSDGELVYTPPDLRQASPRVAKANGLSRPGSHFIMSSDCSRPTSGYRPKPKYSDDVFVDSNHAENGLHDDVFTADLSSPVEERFHYGALQRNDHMEHIFCSNEEVLY